MKKIYAVFILNCLFISCAYAITNTVAFVPVNKNIQNLDFTLSKAKQAIHFFAFPKEVPAAAAKMYASIDAYGKNGYVIHIGTMADCNGARVCNIGSLIYREKENITIYFNSNNQQETYPVILANGIHGYYTKGFAMGDFWPANIQWRDGSILYVITWNIDNKAAFVRMANSVIRELHGISK